MLKVTVVPARRRVWVPHGRCPTRSGCAFTNEALEEQLAGLLGGRIAEEVELRGTLGAGALSDLERATKTAYAMVAYYGMSKKIGPISSPPIRRVRAIPSPNLSRAGQTAARHVDCEVRRVLEDAYACARKIIERKNDRINAMADLLLEKETDSMPEEISNGFWVLRRSRPSVLPKRNRRRVPEAGKAAADELTEA